MTVAFIVTSYWAYGELLIAAFFAQSIAKQGFQPYFIIPPSHEKIIKEYGFKYSLLIPKLGKINRILLADCQHKYKPEFVILSDFINYRFCEGHYGLTRKDLEIFTGTIGTFDIFHWDLQQREMDTYGFRAKNAKEIDTHGFAFKLLPCPIINPMQPSLSTTGDSRDFYYSLLETFLDYNRETKKALRKEMGLPPDKKICITTSAVWQSTYKQYPHVKHFVRKVSDAFLRILAPVLPGGIILSVGKGAAMKDIEGCQVIELQSLSPAQFEKYALASDLFVTTNMTSTTLARFALSGLPCAALINSKPRTGDIKKDLDIDYPYRMFPVGWYHFLEPVLHQNPYGSLVTQLEVFDTPAAIEGLKALVYDNRRRQQCLEQAATLKEQLRKLPKPATGLHRFLQTEPPVQSNKGE